jgi:hypothetical protein
MAKKMAVNRKSLDLWRSALKLARKILIRAIVSPRKKILPADGAHGG